MLKITWKLRRTYWGDPIETQRESVITSIEELKKELAKEITGKVHELGISREQLELYFEIGSIEI